MGSNEIFNIIRKNKKQLAKLNVKRLGLFGSQVRGDSTPDSDIDFLVEFVEGKKSYDNFIELCFFLEDQFGKRVDLLTTDSISPILKDQIAKESRFEDIN